MSNCQHKINNINIENMTEANQTKFVPKNNNQNNIIYFGIFSITITILYVYRFHFATVIISYILGCLASYICIHSSILQRYLENLKDQFSTYELDSKQVDNAHNKGCVTCGSKECNRHDGGVVTEPWVGLQVHKQLDQAIEDFYNTILDQFISSWYNKISQQPFFVDELRHQLRYASACLYKRAVKIDYARLLTRRVLPCALRHVTSSPRAAAAAPHVAAARRASELRYLRAVSDAVTPLLLKGCDLDNQVFSVLVREILSGWVLLPLADAAAEPRAVSALLALAAQGEAGAAPPAAPAPDYTVEFLETFVRQTESVYSQRCKLMNINLEFVLNEQEYFYAFMQYLKTTSHIHLLQFYKDIKLFQTKLLNPELSPVEEASLISEARDIYATYFDPSSPSCVQLSAELGSLLHAAEGGSCCVRRLQTSRELYQAARTCRDRLERVMLPRFLHSEQFYDLLIGSRQPSGYQKQMTRKPQEKLMLQALKLGHRIRGALKQQTLDGHPVDNCEDTSDSESVDNIDILKYLDMVASEDSLRDQDLSTCKVVVTNIETRMQEPPRRGPVRSLTVAVHRLDGAGSASLWAVERTEHDFHLLRAKLAEFHADKLFEDLPLPSRRDNSPMETLRYKYEDFLQRLLQKSLLQTSELLHLFLTVEGDFSLVVQASSLAANNTDLTNIYQSVTHKLRKEKGQHLECFLKSFLISCDMERFQSIKPPSLIEEGVEVNEDAVPTPTGGHPRDIHSTCFGDNLGVDPPYVTVAADTRHQSALVGFTQCFMYILRAVEGGGAWRWLRRGAGAALGGAAGPALDAALERALAARLRRALPPPARAQLVRLAHEQIFGKKTSQPRPDATEQREKTRKLLLECIPSSVALIGGNALTCAINSAFQILQSPQLNKQLVYNLFDLCLVELFPELLETTTHEPNS